MPQFDGSGGRSHRCEVDQIDRRILSGEWLIRLFGWSRDGNWVGNAGNTRLRYVNYRITRRKRPASTDALVSKAGGGKPRRTGNRPKQPRADGLFHFLRGHDAVLVEVPAVKDLVRQFLEGDNAIAVRVSRCQ